MSGIGPTTMEQVRASVDRAKPFIDAGPTPSTQWKASDLLMIGFCMIETGRGGVEAAVQFCNDMLDEARNRYAAGFYANPFLEPVVVRPAAKTEKAE